TCGISCVGRTNTQVNCTGNDYSNCDCGVNATFNTITKMCVATCGDIAKTETRACLAADSHGTDTWNIILNTCTNTKRDISIVVGASTCACNSGFTWNGTICAKDVVQICTPNSVQSCPITNGTGQKKCNSQGSSWDACTPTTCQYGYVKSGNSCVLVTCGPMPRTERCRVSRMCPAGGGRSDTDIVPTYLNMTGTFGQVIVSTLANENITDPKYRDLSTWGGLSYRCDADGIWKQHTDGYCGLSADFDPGDLYCDFQNAGG
ncbi:MAG: hypothetical protein WA160_02205, partial [Pseudobdellovibrio sp.]